MIDKTPRPAEPVRSSHTDLTPAGGGAAASAQGSEERSFANQSADEAPRILVVEDDFIVGMELEAGLGDAGFEVVGVARTAEEALEFALAHRPVLVVMDVRLASRRDGVDAAIDIFRETGVRSIFATANQDIAGRAKAAAANPLAWLAKPYQVEALAALIRRMLAEMG